jgi:hypothetical protein
MDNVTKAPPYEVYNLRRRVSTEEVLARTREEGTEAQGTSREQDIDGEGNRRPPPEGLLASPSRTIERGHRGGAGKALALP